MSKITLTVLGGDAIARTLNDLPSIFTQSAVIDVLETAGAPMRDFARNKAPRSDSAPHMADSIDFGPGGRFGLAQARQFQIALGPSTKFFYGRFQEYGTVHHPAQPFLRPAFDLFGNQVIASVGAQFWGMVKRAA